MTTLAKTRTRIGPSIAADQTRIKNRNIILAFGKNTDDIWRPCTCGVCGRLCDLITTAHAESHGFADKYEMIAAGKVHFLTGFVNYREMTE